MILRIFLDADTCSDKKENNQCFSKAVDDTGENDKGDMISLVNMKMENALNKSQNEHQYGHDTHHITGNHKKPHRGIFSVLWSVNSGQ